MKLDRLGVFFERYIHVRRSFGFGGWLFSVTVYGSRGSLVAILVLRRQEFFLSFTDGIYFHGFLVAILAEFDRQLGQLQ